MVRLEPLCSAQVRHLLQRSVPSIDRIVIDAGGCAVRSLTRTSSARNNDGRRNIVKVIVRESFTASSSSASIPKTRAAPLLPHPGRGCEQGKPRSQFPDRLPVRIQQKGRSCGSRAWISRSPFFRRPSIHPRLQRARFHKPPHAPALERSPLANRHLFHFCARPGFDMPSEARAASLQFLASLMPSVVFLLACESVRCAQQLHSWSGLWANPTQLAAAPPQVPAASIADLLPPRSIASRGSNGCNPFAGIRSAAGACTPIFLSNRFVSSEGVRIEPNLCT